MSLTFDEALASKKFLQVESPYTVRCRENCGRHSQGTAFLGPALQRGGVYELTFKVDAKPGRMHYFFGIASEPFDKDAGYQEIQSRSYSLENLYASVHCEGSCGTKSTPLFHTVRAHFSNVRYALFPCWLLTIWY